MNISRENETNNIESELKRRINNGLNRKDWRFQKILNKLQN